MITLNALEKSFGQNHVRRGVTLQVPKGSSMVIIGGSGTGKSVLLKCILGLVTPDRGTITVADTSHYRREAGTLSRDQVVRTFAYQSQIGKIKREASNEDR